VPCLHVLKTHELVTEYECQLDGCLPVATLFFLKKKKIVHPKRKVWRVAAYLPTGRKRLGRLLTSSQSALVCGSNGNAAPECPVGCEILGQPPDTGARWSEVRFGLLVAHFERAELASGSIIVCALCSVARAPTRQPGLYKPQKRVGRAEHGLHDEAFVLLVKSLVFSVFFPHFFWRRRGPTEWRWYMPDVTRARAPLWSALVFATPNNWDRPFAPTTGLRSVFTAQPVRSNRHWLSTDSCVCASWFCGHLWNKHKERSGEAFVVSMIVHDHDMMA
jgi:hypothetical protein